VRDCERRNESLDVWWGRSELVDGECEMLLIYLVSHQEEGLNLRGSYLLVGVTCEIIEMDILDIVNRGRRLLGRVLCYWLQRRRGTVSYLVKRIYRETLTH
jgi:hypothetical protein